MRVMDLLATISTTFKIGRGTVTMAGLTVARTVTVQDKTQTLAALDDIPTGTSLAAVMAMWNNGD